MNTEKELIGRWAIDLNYRLGKIVAYGQTSPMGDMEVMAMGFDGIVWTSQALTLLHGADSTKLDELIGGNNA